MYIYIYIWVWCSYTILRAVLVGLSAVQVGSWTPYLQGFSKTNTHYQNLFYLLCTNPNILFLFGQDFLFVHFFNYYYYYYCLKQRLSQCDKLLLEHQFSLTPIRTWKFGDSLLKFMCVTKWWYAASRFLQFYLMYVYLIPYVVQYLFTDS